LFSQIHGTRSFFDAGIHPLPKYLEPSAVFRSLFTQKRRFIKITAQPPPCTLPTYNSLKTTYLLIYLPTYPQPGHYLPTHQPHRSFSSICFVVCFLLVGALKGGGGPPANHKLPHQARGPPFLYSSRYFFFNFQCFKKKFKIQ